MFINLPSELIYLIIKRLLPQNINKRQACQEILRLMTNLCNRQTWDDQTLWEHLCIMCSFRRKPNHLNYREYFIQQCEDLVQNPPAIKQKKRRENNNNNQGNPRSLAF